MHEIGDVSDDRVTVNGMAEKIVGQILQILEKESNVHSG